MDAALPLDLPHMPLNIITMMPQHMSLSDRLKCALVCKAWAAAATRSISRRDRIKDLGCLQKWLEKHGGQVEVLQLNKAGYTHSQPGLTALPCPQLQDLMLVGSRSLDGRVWSDIAAATNLTSVSLEGVQTASQQADVVSALTALPDLEQLIWNGVECKQQYGLTDSKLLQKLTKLTALEVNFAGAAALQHLGLLTRLQDLSINVSSDTAGCPGLQELKALTRLTLYLSFVDIPASVSQLTALQQLDVTRATQAAITRLQVLTGLTQLCVRCLQPEAPPLQLPGLQHLEVQGMNGSTMPKSFLGSCTQLQVLKLSNIHFSPGSLVASSMLQHPELCACQVRAADEAAGPVSWKQVFPGPGRLPHLTSLTLSPWEPDLQHADIECVVACCSSLQVLDLGSNLYGSTIPGSVISALIRLSGLTSLSLGRASDQQCSSLAQLTGLRDLTVYSAREMSAAGRQQLAVLEQLTSLRVQCIGVSHDELRGRVSDCLPGRGLFDYVVINQVCMQGDGGVLPHNHQHLTC